MVHVDESLVCCRWACLVGHFDRFVRKDLSAFVVCDSDIEA